MYLKFKSNWASYIFAKFGNRTINQTCSIPGTVYLISIYSGIF